jgi:hypothetical protein
MFSKGLQKNFITNAPITTTTTTTPTTMLLCNNFQSSVENMSNDSLLSSELIERMRKRKCFADKELEELTSPSSPSSSAHHTKADNQHILVHNHLIEQSKLKASLDLQQKQSQQQQAAAAAAAEKKEIEINENRKLFDYYANILRHSSSLLTPYYSQFGDLLLGNSRREALSLEFREQQTSSAHQQQQYLSFPFFSSSPHSSSSLSSVSSLSSFSPSSSSSSSASSASIHSPMFNFLMNGLDQIFKANNSQLFQRQASPTEENVNDDDEKVKEQAKQPTTNEDVFVVGSNNKCDQLSVADGVKSRTSKASTNKSTNFSVEALLGVP